MRNTNPNTYIQYVNDNGHVKTVEVDRQVEDKEIIYTTPPIPENFFILSLFDLNQRVFGLTFAYHQNLEALGFLNSEFQTLEALPLSGYFPANTEVSIVKDTTNYDINFDEILPNNQNFEESELTFLKSYLKQNYVGGSYSIVPMFKTFLPIDISLPLNANVYYYGRFINGAGLEINERVNRYNTIILNDYVTKNLFFTDIEVFNQPVQFIGYKIVFNFPVVPY